MYPAQWLLHTWQPPEGEACKERNRAAHATSKRDATGHQSRRPHTTTAAIRLYHSPQLSPSE